MSIRPRLIQQPSHSPELNPVEHLWEELREKYLPNKAFKSLDAVEHALCKGLREHYNGPIKVSSVKNSPLFPGYKLNCEMV